MKHTPRTFAPLLALILLVSCGTLTEIKDANQLIQADNELALLVASKGRDATGTAEAQLVIAGQQALDQAERLSHDASLRNRLQAVSWYRIAATSFWQSGAPESVSQMFQAARQGKELCASLGDQAPDRDKLYLSLLIPYAAFEASTRSSPQGLLLDLGDVDFSDDRDTDREIERLQDSYARLQTERTLLVEIDALRLDGSLLGHPTLKAYYDNNSTKAHAFFENARQKLGSRTAALEARFPARYEALGFTVAEVDRLRCDPPEHP